MTFQVTHIHSTKELLIYTLLVFLKILKHLLLNYHVYYHILLTIHC